MKNIGNKKMKLNVIFIFALLFSPFLQAAISVSADRTPVVADESFKLTFAADHKVDAEPNFGPLSKDFTILSTGVRSNTQIINGDVKFSKQWIVTLIANKTGMITIPSIRFGKESSTPSQINVVDSASPVAGSNTDDIFINVEVSTKKPYVQAQVIYTVKLYYVIPIPIQTNNATLSEPKISSGRAVINKLGDDKRFQTQINGKPYTVIQRQYAIFPQSSGTLKINPLLFQGQTGANSFFGADPFAPLFGADPFAPQAKSIVKRSEGVVLDVKPIPDSFTGDTWLPASQLNIQEQWSVEPDKLKQGDATTRTLTLSANGLAASHLPQVESHLPDKLKRYPDQPELEEKNNGNGYVGIRREKMAIVPTETGDYVLPAIKIPWWNTKTDKMEIADLPERTIHVNALDAVVTDDTRQQQKVDKQVLPTETTDGNKNKETAIVNNAVTKPAYWKLISIVLFIMWLVTLFVLFKIKNKTISKHEQHSSELSHRHYLNQLKQACARNDAVATKQSLLTWAKNKWPNENINSINSIKRFCNKALQSRIDELNALLYGNKGYQWDGAAFLQSFESQSFEKKVISSEKGQLEPLYKT